jgi:hypothetical protein
MTVPLALMLPVDVALGLVELPTLKLPLPSR